MLTADSMSFLIRSRFASEEEVFSPDFANINNQLLDIQERFNLLDQSELNTTRFKWASKIQSKSAYYASRMWEYPFAIISASLRPGMIVADMGCGNTPLTAFLAEFLGSQNVYGYDPDVLGKNSSVHSHFSANLSYLDQLGIHFHQEDIASLSAENDKFDVVFCISVLEHIDDSLHKARGIKEMARTVKPGGKLILTFDIGLNLPLNHLWDIISVSGLIPLGLDASWPKKRFVDYGSGCTVDVFGLVLYKPNESIYYDYSEERIINASIANQRMQDKTLFYALPYWQALAAHDLATPMGATKVFIKKLLGRY